MINLQINELVTSYHCNKLIAISTQQMPLQPSSQLSAISLGIVRQLEKEAEERRAKAGGGKYDAEPHPQFFADAVLDEKGESAQIAATLNQYTNNETDIDYSSASDGPSLAEKGKVSDKLADRPCATKSR